MKEYEIKNKDKPLANALKIKYCQSFFCQLIGLMFTSTVKMEKGLLLVQSSETRIYSSIHMFFVLTDLAVIWINSNLLVVDKVLAKTWRPFYIPRTPALYVLEINGSRLGEFNIGDHLELI